MMYKTITKKLSLILYSVLGSALIIVILIAGLSSGIDKSIDNQNIMICDSAKKSGNEIYLDKCSVYYETGKITDFKY